jgi:lysophospholipase L1-like esterase
MRSRLFIVFCLISFLVSEIFFSVFLFSRADRFWIAAFQWTAINAAVITGLEIIFQLAVKWKTGSFYQKVEKVKWDNLLVEPHPFLTFFNKRNLNLTKPRKIKYPLHADEGYSLPPAKTNNLRHSDGLSGDRQVVIPKPEGLIRVLCLGASTTVNCLTRKGVTTSYTMELEGYLQRRFPEEQIVVNNCGQGGWTSAEILINFLLNLRDTDPDIVVIYHAYNDLPVSLTPGFVPDYSHARRNLGESYYKYRLASLIPMLPLGIYNFAVQTLYPYINPLAGVLGAISRNEIDLDGDFKGLEAYRRNLEYIVKLCLIDKIDVTLSTFAYFLYDEVKNSKTHLKYREGVRLENEVIRQMGEKYGVPVVDNARLVPADAKYFVDSIHFTPEGMQLIAENIGEEVAKIIDRRRISPANEAVQL